MNANTNEQRTGIAALPQAWAVATQLIGTFGLAVFLVVYYVLVMQPRDNARYEGFSKKVGELEGSVRSLEDLVESKHTLLTRQQARLLEIMYVEAVAPEIASMIVKRLKKQDTEGDGRPSFVIENKEDLEKRLEDKLIERTAELRNFARKDGGTVSESLVNKIRQSEIAKRLLERIEEMHSDSLEGIQTACTELTQREFALLDASK